MVICLNDECSKIFHVYTYKMELGHRCKRRLSCMCVRREEENDQQYLLLIRNDLSTDEGEG